MKKIIYFSLCFIIIGIIVFYVFFVPKDDYRDALDYSIKNSYGEYKNYESEIIVDKNNKDLKYYLGCSRGNFLSLVSTYNNYLINNTESYLNDGYTITFVFCGKASKIPYMTITNKEMDGVFHDNIDIVRMEYLHGGLQDLEKDADGKIVGIDYLEIPNSGEESKILEYVNLFSNLKTISLVIKDGNEFSKITESINKIFPDCIVKNMYSFLYDGQRESRN